MKERIAVKIGSNVLTRKDGMLDVTQMSALVDQIAELHKNGYEIIVISSGAVAAGKTELKIKEGKLDRISSRQLYATIGQAKLINRYYDLFHQHKIVCGQVLATKEDFSTRRHYLNQRNCMEIMIDNMVIPIVNENDAVSINELMFTDNDELSGLVAAMMDCTKLIILSNINGLYNGDPSDSVSTVIREIHPDDKPITNIIQKKKSSAGRGGMQTKYNIARKVSEEGIEVIIANGRTPGMLLSLATDEDVVCTRFLAAQREISSIKKWIAHSDGYAKGEIYINAGAKEVLLSNNATSLLPVGVVSVKGDFEADDIVKIIDDETGLQIAIGKTAYSSKQAADAIGKNNKKPIIHCDYLYIEK